MAQLAISKIRSDDCEATFLSVALITKAGRHLTAITARIPDEAGVPVVIGYHRTGKTGPESISNCEFLNGQTCSFESYTLARKQFPSAYEEQIAHLTKLMVKLHPNMLR